MEIFHRLLSLYDIKLSFKGSYHTKKYKTYILVMCTSVSSQGVMRLCHDGRWQPRSRTGWVPWPEWPRESVHSALYSLTLAGLVGEAEGGQKPLPERPLLPQALGRHTREWPPPGKIVQAAVPGRPGVSPPWAPISLHHREEVCFVSLPRPTQSTSTPTRAQDSEGLRAKKGGPWITRRNVQEVQVMGQANKDLKETQVLPSKNQSDVRKMRK